MPVMSAAAALLSRGSSGAFILTSALAFRRKTTRSNVSSAFFSASAAVLSPLLLRHWPLPALLLPSPPPHRTSRRCHQLSCLDPSAPQESAAAATVGDEDGDSIPPVADPAVVLSDPVREAAGLLDIRVGRVLRAWRHPEANSLYVEEVDVGEAEPRNICSGLVPYVPLEALEGARVVVLSNLKPRNMRGVKSNGMLLAASDAAHETVELLVAPEGAAPGERVWFAAEGHKEEQPEPATPNQVQKKKIWESVQPHLKTDENFVAMLGAHPMQTSMGVVVCRSLKNARVS